MSIFRRKQVTTASLPVYAHSTDFCRVFEDDMDRLYLLSLLLTADPERAEKCFVRGLEDTQKGNPVFKEWAQSWARRSIIISAIRMLGPRPDKAPTATVTSVSPTHGRGLPSECATVLSLQPFERFVFVISVLEGYSDRDCRLLLDCSAADIAEARARAFEHLGDLAMRRNKAANASFHSHNEEVSSSPGVTTRLAASV